MSYSVTYVGIIVVLLTTLFQRSGLVAEQAKLQEFALTLVQIVGLCVAAVGRWRAGGIKWYGAKAEDSKDETVA